MRLLCAHSGHGVVVALNPPGQYGDDRNLRARQRLWRCQDPYFDVVAWVLDLAGLSPGLRVLDAGCGNGEYLRALARQPVHAAGCDLSLGMLRAGGGPAASPAARGQASRYTRPGVICRWGCCGRPVARRCSTPTSRRCRSATAVSTSYWRCTCSITCLTGWRPPVSCARSSRQAVSAWP